MICQPTLKSCFLVVINDVENRTNNKYENQTKKCQIIKAKNNNLGSNLKKKNYFIGMKIYI